jgi:hypothetical protein
MRHEIINSTTESIRTPKRRSLFSTAALLVAGPILVFGQTVQTSTGSIAGTVSAQDGTPIAGAAVLYGKLAASTVKTAVPSLSPPILSVYTGPTGGFSIPSLTPATYLICVQVAGGGYLDPCHWSTTPTTVAVSAGQAVAGVNVRVAKGARLAIPVSDPQQLLTSSSSTTGAAAIPSVRVAVVAVSGALIPAVLTASASTARTYTVTLPFDSATGIFVLTGGYQLTSSAAFGISAVASGGQTIQVTAPSSGPLPSLSFTVTGLAASTTPDH